jgi:hypothetical protein
MEDVSGVLDFDTHIRVFYLPMQSPLGLLI